MNTKKVIYVTKISSLLILIFSALSTRAQLSYTGFEAMADETVFTQALWTSQGFTVPWVNGFNVNRGHIDNAFAKFGTNSLRIDYPINTFGPTNSGAQAPLMVTPANQYYISYWVRFSDNFSWGNSNQGGKLPGLAGGGRCSGCATCTGLNGFSARLMWRPGGLLVLYLYHLDKVNPPCGDNIPLVVGGSNYYITKGVWFNVIERVKVNTGTNHDGEVEIWINGQPALLKTGIQFVSNGDKVDALYFSTFHGGNDATWAPTVSCKTWFDDIKISTNVNDIFTPLLFEQNNENTNDTKLSKKNELIIFPQPIKAGATINIDLSEVDLPSTFDVQWFDNTGKLLEEETNLAPSSPIKVPIQKNGIYLLKFILEKEVIVKKIIIE